MEYQVGSVGRVVVARLFESDPVYESILEICRTESITSAVFWVIGGVKNVSVVTGPEDHTVRPLQAIVAHLPGVQEIIGTGTVFLNGENELSIHMHASLGHDSHTVTGCPRVNLDCWLINEVVVQEITGITAKRLTDASGYQLLRVGGTE